MVGKDGKIICVQIDKGRKHDFRVFKESKIHVHSAIKIETDSGYQGIKKYHANSELPYKQSKKKILTKEQKEHNHSVSSSRVFRPPELLLIKVTKVETPLRSAPVAQNLLLN